MTSLPPLSPSLESLVAPLGAVAFLRDAWRQRVFHAPGGPERLAGLIDELGTAALEDMLSESLQYVVIGDYEGERLPRHLGPAEAITAYATRGATLYFRMPDSFALSGWTRALAHDLGEPPVGVTSLFAVRNRHGTSAHLDWNENFTIQIRGTKRWRVAQGPAECLPNPVTNWAIGDPPPLYADAARLPDGLPADAREYLMAPGSVLYVPRGFLHEVASVDEADSLSLNFSFPPTPWAVALTTLLANRMLGNPALRAGLGGAFGSGWGRDGALAQIPEMLEALRREADHVGEDLRRILDDPQALRDYLARRGFPRL